MIESGSISGPHRRCRYRERRKRRKRERRLERPFSERRGALPATISISWLLGLISWFLVVDITHFTIETAEGIWKASAVYEQGHEHLGWK
jgi:hypothetical protein